MATGLTIWNYSWDNISYDLGPFVSEISFKCSLSKPCQEVSMKVTFKTFTKAYDAHYIDTGSPMEIYSGTRCIFRGKVIVSKMVSDETLEIECFDYIWWLMKSKICMNFEDLTPGECIKKILNEIGVPYSDDGIATDDSITISHLIKNKTAYQAIMEICTEMHRSNGLYYYVYMDVAGNINVFPCDKYICEQIIQPCTTREGISPDGDMMSFTYTRDMNDMITRVKCYTNKGEEAALDGSTKEDEDEEDE